MLLLLGTAHVLDLSIGIERAIRNFNPDIVALELDKDRWAALNSPSPSRNEGPLFLKVLAYLQKRLSEVFGSPPGSDMLAAASTARKIGATLAFIDLPIVPVLKKSWFSMPFKEKSYLFFEMLSLFLGLNKVEKQIEKSDWDFSSQLAEFAIRYPTLREQLIERRDRFMAVSIIKLLRKQSKGNPLRIAVVVGEGHLDGLSRSLSTLNPEVIHLKELVKMCKGDSYTLTIQSSQEKFNYST